MHQSRSEITLKNHDFNLKNHDHCHKWSDEQAYNEVLLFYSTLQT